MSDLLDYIEWRGDLSLSASPWCGVDALLIAVVSYLDISGTDSAEGWTLADARRMDLVEKGESSSFEGRKKAFDAMAASERFGGIRIHHFIALTDTEREMQFSAMCADLPDGTMVVAFRGTDNTIIGWKEDFNMAYQASVPAQEAAAYYLRRAAESTGRPLRLIGHSKGGNLAVYSAMMAPAEIQDRIESIWSFDGPGLNHELTERDGLQRIKSKVRHFVPQSSIIGLLMDYCEPYTVVRSGASGLSQHDPLTWGVRARGFEEMESIDSTAVLIRDTLHDWLDNSTAEQRGLFVETMFRMVESTKATKVSDITGEKLKSIQTMLNSRKEVDQATRRVFSRLVAQAVTLGFGNMVRMRAEKPLLLKNEVKEQDGRKNDNGETGTAEE